MKQQQTNKHSNLHREDQHITIEELWRGWKSSEGEHNRACTCKVLKLPVAILSHLKVSSPPFFPHALLLSAQLDSGHGASLVERVC